MSAFSIFAKCVLSVLSVLSPCWWLLPYPYCALYAYCALWKVRTRVASEAFR
jgi:hypothetical protein